MTVLADLGHLQLPVLLKELYAENSSKIAQLGRVYQRNKQLIVVVILISAMVVIRLTEWNA